MSGASIAQNLCEAVEIIVDNAIRDLAYDQTIKCTIVDASESASGKYIVRDGFSKLFTAYSTEKYLKNTQVYVTIPKGDYEGTKIITGKVVTTAEEPFIYNSPFDTYIDITGNLVNGSVKKGLLTNSKTKTQEQLLNYDFTNGKGYTRLGLSAEFAAWLFEQECVSGNYGVRLEIIYTRGELKNSETVQTPELCKSIVYLGVKDMVGNPYHFESFYRQEKVFDVSDMDQILNIQAYFFQDQNFIDKNGNPIPHLFNQGEVEDDVDQSLWGSELQPNLFIQNLHISLGYGQDEIGDEFAQITTSNSLTYSATSPNNKKQLSLKWLRKNDQKQLYNVTDSTEFQNEGLYEVRWYQYDIAANPYDEYGGVRWKVLSDNNIAMSCEFTPEPTKATEQIKAVVIYGKFTYEWVQGLTADEFKGNPTSYYVKQLNGEYKRCEVTSVFNASEKYYLRLGEKTAKTSNVITFNNEQEVASAATIKALSALQLICYDAPQDGSSSWIQSHGNYFYYGDSGALIDKAQANIQRKIEYEFTPIDGTAFNPAKAKATWTFPKRLEEFEVVKITKAQYDADPSKYYIFSDPVYRPCTSKDTFSTTQTYHTCKVYDDGTMIRNFKVVEGTSTTKSTGYFNISSYLSSSYSNNTIALQLTYDGVDYYATTTLTFGQSSLMGIGYNIDLQFTDSQNALLVDGTANLEYRANVKLYNASGIEQPIADGLTIDLEAVHGGSNTSPYVCTKSGNQIIFTSTGNTNLEQFLIVKISVTGLSNVSSDTSYTISKLFPIPFKTNKNLQYLTGPSEIKYAIDGTLTNMSHNPYQLYYGDGTVKRWSGSIDWTIKTCHYKDGVRVTSVDDDTPLVMPVKITEAGLLKPYPMWEESDGSRETYYAVSGVTKNQGTWIQPLPISKTSHFSSIIDNWKSGTISVNDDSGTILAPRIGAGKKSEDNKFTGVILGDWDGNMSGGKDINRMGLYGFNAGDATFGFNQDGTAFIGGSSTGRILFNGTTSTIKSKAYEEGLSGMELNLTEGTIKAYDFTLFAKNKDDSQKYIKLTTDGNEPLKLGSNFTVDWTGQMNAQSGQIGNWHISTDESKRLKNSSGSVYLDPRGTIYGSAIKTGNKDTDPNFHVNSSGSLGIGRKKDASGDTINSTNYNFVIESSGKVTITGEGSISFVDDAIDEAKKELGDDLSDAKTEIGKEITNILGEIDTIEDNIDAIGQDISTLEGNLENTNTDVSDLFSDLQDARTKLANNIQALATGAYTGFEDLDGVWHPAGKTFINGNTIYAPQIIGGSVEGASFTITGVSWGTGYTASALNFFDPMQKAYQGDITYDNTGAGTDQEATYRLWIRSLTALKLQSGSKGMSLEALSGKIHMMSDTHFYDSVGFGGSVTFSGSVNMKDATVTGFYAKFA